MNRTEQYMTILSDFIQLKLNKVVYIVGGKEELI